MPALEVCEAISRGIKKTSPDFEITLHPMADGGDGSLDVISNHLSLTAHQPDTFDPLGRPITTVYFTSTDTAFIELASASGLVLLDEEERSPMETSTKGTGEMLANAISKGYKNIFLFLGGSATNDGGMGIASALGFQFLDDQQNILQPVGKNLLRVQSISPTVSFDLDAINITLLCDVTNPLYGPYGAAHVYAPQKGASPEQEEFLDKGLRHYARVLKNHSGIEVDHLPGSGAAGGIAASLVALCGAKLVNGFYAIAELTDLEEQIKSADWVISGEGKLDDQSLQGKVISGVAELCEKYEKPLALFVGKNELNAERQEQLNAKAVFSIMDQVNSIEDAMSGGGRYLEEMGERFASEFITPKDEQDL